MGTFSTNILPSNTGQDLGSPSQRWDAYIQTLDAQNVLGAKDATTYSGSDAGAKIIAAIADSVFSGGGVVDARGFGAGNQTVSSAITVGAASTPVTLLLNPATTFIPATSIDMFAVGANGVIDGLTVDCSAIAYSANVVKFPDTNTDGQRARLSNFLIKNGTVTTGVTTGTAVLMKATNNSNYIAFASLERGRIVGFGTGIYLYAEGTSGGSNFVNGNYFSDIEIKNTVTAIKLQSNAGDVIGNLFSNVSCQYGPQCVTALSLGASAAANCDANQFINFNAWDYTAATAVYNLNADTRGNYIQGQGFTNTGAVNVDSGTSNSILDFEAGRLKPVPDVTIPANGTWTFTSGSSVIGAFFATGLTVSGNPILSGSPSVSGTLGIASGGGLNFVSGSVLTGTAFSNLVETGSHTFSGNLIIGSAGTSLTQAKVYSQTITPSSVTASTAAEQTFTVTGLTTADVVIVNPAATGNSTMVGAARVSAADTLAIQFVNPTVGNLTPAAGTYKILAVRS